MMRPYGGTRVVIPYDLPLLIGQTLHKWVGKRPLVGLAFVADRSFAGHAPT